MLPRSVVTIPSIPPKHAGAGVLVDVLVGVAVGVGVLVGVEVGVGVSVAVEVAVGVLVGIARAGISMREKLLAPSQEISRYCAAAASTRNCSPAEKVWLLVLKETCTRPLVKKGTDMKPEPSSVQDPVVPAYNRQVTLVEFVLGV